MVGGFLKASSAPSTSMSVLPADLQDSKVSNGSLNDVSMAQVKGGPGDSTTKLGSKECDYESPLPTGLMSSTAVKVASNAQTKHYGILQNLQLKGVDSPMLGGNLGDGSLLPHAGSTNNSPSHYSFTESPRNQLNDSAESVEVCDTYV